MAGRSRTLHVPYFPQPTGITCQSTCLKMMAGYVEESVVRQSTGAGEREILDIWKDINTGSKRPAHERNSFRNMAWWLQTHFPSVRVERRDERNEANALERIVGYIDGGFPVLVGVSHARVPGHIILVVGYENYVADMSSPEFNLVVHDPYGRFDPLLRSKLFGAKRWQGGLSLAAGGALAPGAYVRLPITAVGRRDLPEEARARAMAQRNRSLEERTADAIEAAAAARERFGWYNLLSARR